MIDGSGLKVLYLSVEVSPFAKTGGLGDVAGSLPQALAEMGNDVRVVMPKYKMVNAEMVYAADFSVDMAGRKEACIIRKTFVRKKGKAGFITVPVYFIDSFHYFDREGIYGHFDDAERFIFFCKAIFKMLPAIDFQPDIIHCNDWHTGPVCMLLKEKYKTEAFFKKTASVFTIHNLQYQGHFGKDVLKLLGFDEEYFTFDKVEFYGMFNFIKAGLVYADIINTVSEQYAKEIRTEQYGEKLEGVLKSRSSDLYGIVNGINNDNFNPATDNRIFKNYSAETFFYKRDNKIAIQKEMCLPQKDVPVMGLISRLSGQKGLNLLIDTIDELLKLEVQLILVGTGDQNFENTFRNLKLKYPYKLSVYIGFNAGLAQRVYAGSDIFLMPSRFEPCGLGQIISLRYGAIPVVRATGGLADTIVDVDFDRQNGNGFSFNEFSPDEFLKTVKRALKLYNQDKEFWNTLVKRALTLDFSWEKPAEKYLKLYHEAIKKKFNII